MLGLQSIEVYIRIAGPVSIRLFSTSLLFNYCLQSIITVECFTLLDSKSNLCEKSQFTMVICGYSIINLAALL